MKNKIKVFCTAFAIIILFQSCLKNSEYYNDFSTAGASVHLPLAATSINDLAPLVVDLTKPELSFPVFVNVASPKKLNTNVTATLALDTAWFNAYNVSNGDAFTLLPADAYSITGLDVNIPAQTRLGSITVTIKTAMLDNSKDYVLPFTIQKASLPIEQWNHLMLHVVY
jgi:Domain of unknown function (DUF1735)